MKEEVFIGLKLFLKMKAWVVELLIWNTSKGVLNVVEHFVGRIDRFSLNDLRTQRT